MWIKWAVVLGLIVLTGALWGCGMREHYYRGATPLEENWGRSFESAKRGQILDPEAGSDLSPVTGYDGEAALRLLEGSRRPGAGKSAPGTEYGVVKIQK